MGESKTRRLCRRIGLGAAAVVAMLLGIPMPSIASTTSPPSLTIEVTAAPADANYVDRSGPTISWSTVESATAYQIYRKRGTGPEQPLARVLAPLNDKKDVGLDFGATYSYRVEARNGATVLGTSPWVGYQQAFLQPQRATYENCPDTAVVVTTSDAANSAIAAAAPGTAVRLADGDFDEPLNISNRHGTADDPIVICGSRNATVNVFPTGTVMAGKVGVLVEDSSFITLYGFTVRNAQKGVQVKSSGHVVVASLRVQHTAQGGIYVARDSADTIVSGNYISDTGNDSDIPVGNGPVWHQDGRYGEGIYIGNSRANDSCEDAGCEPDRTTRTVVAWNVITDTTAESIEAKEDTTDGLIFNNHTTITPPVWSDVRASIQVKGDGYLVQKNTIASALDGGLRFVQQNVYDKDGNRIEPPLVPHGRNNAVASNTFDMNGSAPIYVVVTGDYSNRVLCSNTRAQPSVPLVVSKPTTPRACEGPGS